MWPQKVFQRQRGAIFYSLGAIYCTKGKKFPAQILKIDIWNNRDTILAFRTAIDRISIYINILTYFWAAGA
jgi:hypothetical protein